MSSNSSAPASRRPAATPAPKQAPVETFRIGRIKAAVWANPGDGGRTFYNVTFTRSYQDEAQQWHDTESFGRDDLLIVAKLADQAHTFICSKLAE